jgi:Vitamin K epoxide reductase family
MEGRAIPPGYPDNPSEWSERLPLLVGALAGLAIALYLTAYQLGWVTSVWEPFFGDGSRRILHSAVSRMLPVPDASLGAAGYCADVVLGSVGGTDRWRSMPRLVLLFGAVVGAMALAAVVLVAVQAFAYHTGCTLCLASVAISIAIVPIAWREVRVSLVVLNPPQRTQ